MNAQQIGFAAFALAAAVSWGLAPMFGKAGLSATDPTTGLLIRTLGVAAVLTVYALATGGFARVAAVGWRPAAFLLAEGILASLVGHLAYFYALKFGEASRAVPITASFPLVAVLAGVLFLGESLTPAKIAGVVLVVAGVWLLKT